MSDQTQPISERAWALVSCDGYCFGASDNPSARGASYWSLCIDDGRHSDWWITPMTDVPTHLLHMDTACTDDGKSPGDGYEHWAIIAKYAETRVDEKTGNTIMLGWRLSDGQLYGEWDEEDTEDEEDEDDDEDTEGDDSVEVVVPLVLTLSPRPKTREHMEALRRAFESITIDLLDHEDGQLWMNLRVEIPGFPDPDADDEEDIVPLVEGYSLSFGDATLNTCPQDVRGVGGDDGVDPTATMPNNTGPALYCTTVHIWTRYDASKIELVDLAEAATSGDAYATEGDSVLYDDPWRQHPEPPSREFFDDGEW